MKHNVYIHDICNNYFNIEYTVNNSDTEEGENPESIAWVGNAHNKLTQLPREHYRYYYENYILYNRKLIGKNKYSKWNREKKKEKKGGENLV